MRNKFVLSILAVVGICTGFMVFNSTEINAADGCPAGKTRLAAKWFPEGSNNTYPLTCKLSTCQGIGKIAVVYSTQLCGNWPFPPCGRVVVKYEAWTGSAPSNWCPAFPNNGPWN